MEEAVKQPAALEPLGPRYFLDFVFALNFMAERKATVMHVTVQKNKKQKKNKKNTTTSNTNVLLKG
jgi:hypothetical protein